MNKKIIAANPKARHDYIIEEKYEAGIVLNGSEVKSLRSKGASIKESFARVDKGEIFLYNMNITPFGPGVAPGYDPKRTRKLLLNKREINKLIGKTQEKGLALVPLNIHFSRGFVKVELGLGRGKKLYDKRHALAEKTQKREIDRAMKERRK
jgi:SsrA-binding protein